MFGFLNQNRQNSINKAKNWKYPSMIKIIVALAIIILESQAKKAWLRNRQAQLLTHLQIGSVILKPNLTKIITFLRPQSLDSQGMTLVLEDYAHVLKKNGQTNISFYDVNCVEENKLCQQMGVTQVPFIFIFNPEGMVEQQYPGEVFSHKQTLIFIKQTLAKIDQGQYMKANQRHYMRIQHLKQLQPQPPVKKTKAQRKAQGKAQRKAQKGGQRKAQKKNQNNLNGDAEEIVKKADLSPTKKQQAKAVNKRASRRTPQSKKVKPQQIRPQQVKLETENKVEIEQNIITSKKQVLSINKNADMMDLFKEPSQINSISENQILMTQQAKEKHQILLNNVHKSRENRRKYFIIGSGSIVPILLVIAIIAGVIYYIRGIINNSSPLGKAITGAKTLYIKVRQEDQKAMK